MPAASNKRSYKSPRRAAQAAKTREMILGALVDQVCDTGRADFSVADIAERAGVAVRTVYRHFPDRNALMDGLDAHLEAETATPDASLEDLEHVGDHLTALFEAFERTPRLVEAGHVTRLGRELRARGRARRGERVRSMIDEWLAPLTMRERRAAFAVFRSMFGSHTWRTMRSELGMTNEETIEATRWVLELFVGDLARRLKAAREGADD